jgi:hypothetical protein
MSRKVWELPVHSDAVSNLILGNGSFQAMSEFHYVGSELDLFAGEKN